MPRKVIRAAQLPPPRKIDDEDFDLICRVSAIPNNQRSALRHWLDYAATEFQQVIIEARTLPSRKEDRLAIKGAIKDLRSAQYKLRRKTGPAGRQALRIAAQDIAPAVSASWMRDRFPNDLTFVNLLTANNSTSPNSMLNNLSAEYLDPFSRVRAEEAASLDQRIQFMQHRRGEALSALLGDVIAALDDGHRAILQLPAGRKPLEHRAFMLAALAEGWHRLGRRPSTGVRSKFGYFCEAVFDAIGWPTQGVNAALADTKKLWRKLYPPG